METTEKRLQMKKEFYRRALAGKKGRGGETVPHPTETENEQFINTVAACLIDLESEVEGLRKKVLPSFCVQFAEFCENFIQKVNNDPLAFGTLIAIFAHTAVEVVIFKRFLTDRSQRTAFWKQH